MSAKVYHAELWGTRENKFAYLMENEISTTKWTALAPQFPFYLFVPQDTELLAEYETGWKITDIMPVNNTGIISKRDRLAFQFDKQAVLRVVQDIYKLSTSEIVAKYPLSSWTSRDGKPEFVKKSVMEYGVDASRLVQVLYRPVDLRWTYYTPKSKGFIAWPVYDVMRHMLGGENVGLVVPRRVEIAGPWKHAVITASIIEHVVVSLKTIDSLFPLFLYPDPEKDGNLFANGTDRHVNLSPKVLKEMGNRLRLSFVPDGTGDLKKTFGPVDVFNYIYAVFHSPTYRERYAEFLKIDFPRVPLTGDKKLFRALCSRGKDLVTLHLLDSPKLSRSITRYPVPGDNLVAKGHPRYLAPGEPDPGTDKPLNKGRVYISPDAPKSGTKGQYIEGVPPEVWEFHIGGYQVCEKWLKDRRGRKLSYDDLTHYQKVVVALKETIRLMEEIDAAVPDWPIR